MYRPSVDWISLSAPTAGRQPTPWVLVNPFHSCNFNCIFSPAKNCVDIVFINLWFKCPVAFLTALRIVTDSIFNSWTLAFHYSYVLQDHMWPGEQSGWTVVWKPSSKEAHLSTHWLNSGWQSKNPSCTLRMGGEAVAPQPSSGLCSKEDFPSSCWVRLKCCLRQRASGGSELNIRLVRKCLPFSFEVWHPSCYHKARPLCQKSVKFPESKHDVSIVQPPFCRLFKEYTLHVKETRGKIHNGYS